MKYNREFEIAWQGLKSGKSTFKYDIDDRFMQEHGGGDREIKDVDAQVTLSFDKKTNFFMLHFDVAGSVTVPCDRCGDDYRMQLWDEFDLLIKLQGGGDENEEVEEDADVVFIPRSETVIDLSNWIYEFVMLSIPLQHIHPDTPDGKPGCNPEALKLLDSLAEPEDKPKDIWKGLEAFKEKEEKKQKPNKK